MTPLGKLHRLRIDTGLKSKVKPLTSSQTPHNQPVVDTKDLDSDIETPR